MFKIGDKVKIVGKSLGRPYESISYSEGIIREIRGHADGSNENNCIEVRSSNSFDTDWFAPQDLISPFQNQIEQMFDDIIKDL